MGKVISLPARESPVTLLIYINQDVEESVESRGDNALVIFARSVERVSALIEKGRRVLARENAVRAAAERRHKA